MTVTFKFIGSIRSLSGTEKFKMTLGKSIVLKEALKRIADKLPKFEGALIDQGRMQPNRVLVLVNGKEISVLNGLETILNNGDEVVFVPISHGG